jgi:hypothetical protein
LPKAAASIELAAGRFIADEVHRAVRAKAPVTLRGCGHLLVAGHHEVGGTRANAIERSVLSEDLADRAGAANHTERLLDALVNLAAKDVARGEIEARIRTCAGCRNFERADPDDCLPVADRHHHQLGT